MMKPKSSPKSHRFLRAAGYTIAAMIWVAATTIASQLVLGYAMLFMLGANTLNQQVWTAVYSALSYVLAMVLIIIVPLAFQRKKLKQGAKDEKSTKPSLSRNELGLRGLPTWTDIGLAPAGFFVYVILSSIITSLFSLFPWFNATEAQNVGFSIYINGFDRIIAFFTLVVVAPIAEEIIFRGWLYGKLRARFNSEISNLFSTIIATFLVSLLFGILHLQWNVSVDVFALSIVLCVLREITGTIYAGILMHMLKNGIAFYLLYVLGLS